VPMLQRTPCLFFSHRVLEECNKIIKKDLYFLFPSCLGKFELPGLSSIYENLGAGNNIASDYPDLDE
jgi:hypothetical protein